MGWRILVFDPEPAKNMLTFKTHSGFHELFDSYIMSNSTNTLVYFDWKTVIYSYVCGLCRTQFMLPNSSRR